MRPCCCIRAQPQAAGEGRRRTRGELHRRIDGDYYGFRDEEDGGALVVAEAAAEEKVAAPKKASTVQKATAVKKATATAKAPVKKPAKALKVKADKA